MTTPLCAVSGYPIDEGRPAVAHVVVRRRDGTKWSPLGFGFRGLLSGPHTLADVGAGPLTDYTRKLLLPGLRRRDGISHSLPRDIEPGEIGRLLAENRLRWDSGRSAEMVEHRVGVMMVRADAHRALVADMRESARGMMLLARAREVLSLAREGNAARGADGKVPDEMLLPLVARMTKAWAAMGSSASLLSDNQSLAGGPHEAALLDATMDVLLLDAALDAVGSGWRPSRMAGIEPDAGFVARFHANMAGLAGRG